MSDKYQVYTRSGAFVGEYDDLDYAIDVARSTEPGCTVICEGVEHILYTSE